MKDVSVVVCTCYPKRYAQLEACLRSVAEQTLQPRETIVVIDGSVELDRALRARGGTEALVSLSTNRGLSVARNVGAARTTSTWVAFLDDDAVAEPTWLERLVEYAEEIGAAGASGRSEPIFEGKRPKWLPSELLWTVGCSYRGLPTRRTVDRNVFGGCAVLRGDVFTSIGGYDTSLGRRATGVDGGEEMDFCIRARNARPTSRFAFVPDAVIRHHVEVGRLIPSYVLRRCYSDGRTKAFIASRSGRRSLSSERRFIARTLPGGLGRYLVTGRWSAAVVLAAGVAAAAVGYGLGRTRRFGLVSTAAASTSVGAAR